MQRTRPVTDEEPVDHTTLAAFGILLGSLIGACFILFLILSSRPGPASSSASGIKPETHLARTSSDTLKYQSPKAIENARSRKLKRRATRPRLVRRKTGVLPSPIATKHNPVYCTSVDPGKTPKMIELQ